MRSKGSRVTLGVWGLRVCSLDVACTVATVRNRSQPFATVRNRSQPSARSPYGRASGKFCRNGYFWRFPTFRYFVSRGRYGWHFVTFRRFQKMYCSFHGRRNTLDVSIVIFRRRCSTLDVSCYVFFVNRIGRAASRGDKVQVSWQAWYFVRCTKN